MPGQIIKTKYLRYCSASHFIKVAIVLSMMLFSTNIYAIPSPDLVINLSASIAQLLGLVSVLFGGVAFSSKNRSKQKSSKYSKTSGILFFVTLGLFIASLGANLLQYTQSIDEKNARLHTNLVRKSIENGKVVGNTSLKTLSFSDQENHKLGISTDKLAEMLESNTPISIIDVREDAEVESGMIAGAYHIRYPDLLTNPNILPETGNNTLLLCYSGNRSSELCGELSKLGRSCNFMIGGYEKWLTESRSLDGSHSSSSDDLRNIHNYTNKDVLLDTPDVRTLVQEDKAEFIDVRYPDEFKLGHLPNAHNITMRALTTDKLQDKLQQLNKEVPYIAACYDKRSCFYSQLIGLSLDRLGIDFRGRYTVPNEYYLPRGERSHVANWRAENEEATLVSLITRPLTRVLNWLSETGGHYVVGIILLVLMVRLSLLPLAIKAERDQIVLKSLKPKIDSLKELYVDHPRALGKATLKLYRDNRIQPIFNLIASFTQLGFLLLFYSVVNAAAKDWTQSFLWIEIPTVADTLFVLPLLVSVLFMSIVSKQVGTISKKKAAMLVVGGLAFFALIAALSAAINIYLTISMVVLISQNFFIGYLSNRFNWSGQSDLKRDLPTDDGLIPLRNAHLVNGTGKKAFRLGELMEAGYNVPDGFVFTDVITHRLIAQTPTLSLPPTMLSKVETKKLSKLWTILKAEKVAVRSSGLNEDGSDTSFAGVYDSILNVTKSELIKSVKTVYSSLASDLAESYNSNVNNTEQSDSTPSDLGGVLIQKMVDAEYAGVMFTEHPANAGAMLIEVVAGLGDDLVAGTVTPDSFSFGKFTLSDLDEQECPIDLLPLLEIGLRLEQMFEHPQDIEWAYADGQFYILQARNITRSICNRDNTTGYSEVERLRLLKMVSQSNADYPVYVQNELSELLPTPTPLSASFMQKLWSAGGSTDLACLQLGIPYDVDITSVDFVTTVFGRTYINKAEEKARLGKGPGAIAAFKLARNADQIESDFREHFLPSFIKSVTINHAIDYSRLSLEQMVNQLEIQLDHFITETYVEAEIVNIAADYYWKTADTKLTHNGNDSSEYLNYVPQTVVSTALGRLSGDIVGQTEFKKFIAEFGHRAPYDYELSSARYSEDPALLINLMKGHGNHPKTLREAPLPDNKLLRISVDRVHRFQALKEDAKHFCMLELNEIRRLIFAMDKSCEFNGDIFQLSLEELLQLDEAGIGAAQETIERRLSQSLAWKSILPPASLTIQDLESMDVTNGSVNRKLDNDALAGKRVAGDEPVRGVARVINSIEEIDDFQKGEILVARMTDPQWYPLFPLARGIITEVGGWLSHAAIVAREYNLPAIVGVSNVCERIKTGDIVELNNDGSISLQIDQRSENSPLRQVVVPPENAFSASDLENDLFSLPESVVPINSLSRSKTTKQRMMQERRHRRHRANRSS